MMRKRNCRPETRTGRPASATRQRLAGVIGDVDRSARRLADQLRGQIGIYLIDRAALTGEDQFRPRLQQRQLDRQQIRHIVMDTMGERQQFRQRCEPTADVSASAAAIHRAEAACTRRDDPR
jgi:hypothetical protein